MGGKSKKQKQGDATKKDRPVEPGQPDKKEGGKDPEKQAEINKILQAVSSMDLDTPDFLDIKSFQEGKQILLNAIDDLSEYINLFKKGDYSKFPAPATVEKQAEQPASK